MTTPHFDDFYLYISLQWQYGASFPQRRSAVFDQSGRGSHQSRRDCGLQNRRQGDPNSTQSTKGPRKVWHDIDIFLISTSTFFSWMSLMVLNCHLKFVGFLFLNLMCSVIYQLLGSLLTNTLSAGKMGILSSWPKETIMQWMTEDCTNRVNTGWRRKTLWDEQGGA